MSSPSETGVLLEHLFRHQSGRMVAHLTRLLGSAHLSLAEETAQEAMLRAWQTWPNQGVPENPAAWLFRTAHNIAIDAIRRQRTLGEKTDAIVAELSRSANSFACDPDVEDRLRDDELRMIFMCCHPEISREAQVALSLKTVGGFSVREIGHAFLADEATIAQRLVRAKKQIREKRLTLEMPVGDDLRRRLDAVLAVIYFMLNEGYAAHEGEDLIRQDLCFEALRLARLVAWSSIANPAAHALVALIAFQTARLPARLDQSGELVLLEDQDRRRWDQNLIALGFHHLQRSMAGDAVTDYHIQAGIAATHARAVDAGGVEWPLILALYDQLLDVNGSPVVALNRAVAVSKVRGAGEALALMEPLRQEAKLRHYHLFLAVRGHLLMDLERYEEAAECFENALKCECCGPERRLLQRRLERCYASGSQTAARSSTKPSTGASP